MFYEICIYFLSKCVKIMYNGNFAFAKAEVVKVSVHQNHSWELLKQSVGPHPSQFLIEESRWDLTICIFNKILGAADAPGPGANV